MNEQLRARIRQTSKDTHGVKNMTRVRSRLQMLAKTEPPPDYDKYIRSKVWQKKRAHFLDHYNHQCVLCGAKDHLHVHHLHYQSVGNETTEDVTVCCRKCHFIAHLPGKDDADWAGTTPAKHLNRPNP